MPFESYALWDITVNLFTMQIFIPYNNVKKIFVKLKIKYGGVEKSPTFSHIYNKENVIFNNFPYSTKVRDLCKPNFFVASILLCQGISFAY